MPPTIFSSIFYFPLDLFITERMLQVSAQVQLWREEIVMVEESANTNILSRISTVSSTLSSR